MCAHAVPLQDLQAVAAPVALSGVTDRLTCWTFRLYSTPWMALSGPDLHSVLLLRMALSHKDSIS